MRILVLSDTHGDARSLMRALQQQPNAEMIIHCGDGRAEVEDLQKVIKDIPIVPVRGNCDWGKALPPTQVIEVAGKRIFITHGHLYQAKFSIYNLVCAAREEKADIVCFGHTHQAMTEYDDGLYILNPGSCHGYGATYAYIDITDKGDIVTNIVRLDREV